MAAAIALLASSTNDAGGWGLLWILLTLIAIAVVVGAVWAFAARRGERMPKRAPHRHDQGVRGS
jgi:threonine/homoserine/homoserine lactone efflux protein